MSLGYAKTVYLAPTDLRQCLFIHMETLDDEYGDEWRTFGELGPAFVAEMAGCRVVIEGTHRTHQAIKDNVSLSALLIRLDWTKEVPLSLLHSY